MENIEEEQLSLSDFQSNGVGPDGKEIQASPDLNLFSKELDFFAFETHVRNILFQLLEPFSKKVAENKKTTDILIKDFEHQQKSLDQIEQIVLRKQSDQPTIFDLIQNKIADHASKTREREEELRKKIDLLEMRAIKTEEDMNSLTSQQNRLDTHMRIALKDVQTIQTEVTQFKEKIETKIKQESDDITTKWTQVKLNLKQANDLLNDLQKQSNYSQDEISRANKLLTTHQDYLEQLNRRIVKVEQIKLDESQFQQYEKQLDQRVKEVRNKIDDLWSCMKQTDNYLEKYLPFNSFCQLFEVLRLTLEPGQINKVKDYEEYRLKELYDIILSDQGIPRTTFDKKYVIQPVGYNFGKLTDGKETKLQNKSKKFIIGRPSFSSAIKLDEKGQPINIESALQSAFTNRRNFSLGPRGRAEIPSISLQNLQMDKRMISTQEALQMKQQQQKQEYIKANTRKNTDYQLPEEGGTQAKDSDEEEIEAELEDAIDDLLAGMHEDNSSLGIKNLNLLKSRLFDPELDLIYQKFDEKIKEQAELQQKDFDAFKCEVLELIKEKQNLLEVFGHEIDNFESKWKVFSQKQQQDIKQQDIKINKIQNMFNYLDLKQQTTQYNSQIPLTPLLNNTDYSSGERFKSRNLNLNTDYIQTNMTNISTKVSQYNTTVEQLKSLNQKNQMMIRGRSPATIQNKSLQSTFTKEDLHMHSSNIFNSESRPKTATQKEVNCRQILNRKHIVVSMKKDVSQQNSMIL